MSAEEISEMDKQAEERFRKAEAEENFRSLVEKLRDEKGRKTCWNEGCDKPSKANGLCGNCNANIGKGTIFKIKGTSFKRKELVFLLARITDATKRYNNLYGKKLRVSEFITHVLSAGIDQIEYLLEQKEEKDGTKTTSAQNH